MVRRKIHGNGVTRHQHFDRCFAELCASLWLATQSQLGVNRMVQMELIVGAPNLQKQNESLRLLGYFIPIPLLDEDVVWVQNQLARYHLSHNIGVFDCLIASSAYRLKLPLYTLNIKHFEPILGSLAQRPY